MVTEGAVVLGSSRAEGAVGASVAPGKAVPAAHGQLLGLACQRWTLRPSPPQQGANGSFSRLLRASPWVLTSPSAFSGIAKFSCFGTPCLPLLSIVHIIPCHTLHIWPLSAITTYHGLDAQLLAPFFISLLISLFPRVSMSNIIAFCSSVFWHLCNKISASDFYYSLFWLL